MRALGAGLLGVVGVVAVAAQSPTVLSVADHVERIVATGGHAGIVARLQPAADLETQLPIAAFLARPGVGPSRVAPDARRALESWAGPMDAPLHVDPQATQCLALLERPVEGAFEGSYHETFCALFNAATRVGRPCGGMVGSASCVGSAHVQRRVQLRGPLTYLEALQRIARQTGSVVWLAVENDRGQCGIGYVVKAEEPLVADGLCQGLFDVQLWPTDPPAGR